MVAILTFCHSMGAMAQEVESYQPDTMKVDWYVSPKDEILLPSFRETFAKINRRLPEQIDKDLSDEQQIEIEEPQFAWVYITGLTTIPTNTTIKHQVNIEVYDGRGNYFSKRAWIKGQGGWSLKYPKRNFSCQFFENEPNGNTNTEIRIGRWVRQDAFHFKAFYTDYFRGIGEIGYKLFSYIVADRPPYWERGGYMETSKRARCFPDGFPCAVYLDGRYIGIYAWQLKKSRKNMNMDKTQEMHIHLDGSLNNGTIFQGTVKWQQFAIQHPKNQYVTQNTKDAIIQLSKYNAEMTELEKSGADSITIKQEFEKRFDIASLIDYDVFYQFVCNVDGSLKNWQWFTYDGQKWMVTPYDLDQIFGLNLYGVVRPAHWEHSQLTEGPFIWVFRYYKDELRQRYIELRQNGAISADNILPIIRDWYDRVTQTMYEQEKVLWPDSPCYGEAICNNGWKVSQEWSLYTSTPDFSTAKLYQAGDVCKLEGRLWEATKNVIGVQPFKRNSQLDSLQRLEKWVEQRIEFLDMQYQMPQIPLKIDSNTQAKSNDVFYNIMGLPVKHPRKGIYIVNGKKVFIK